MTDLPQKPVGDVYDEKGRPMSIGPPPTRLPCRNLLRLSLPSLVIAFALNGGTVFCSPDQVFQSGRHRTTLVEVFGSQGCSSCPPVDAWLNSLGDESGLWQRFVPVAYHVDYWDYLGWKDPFGSTSNSLRQRNYADRKAIGSVYTPCTVVNGREWRGWFTKEELPVDSADAGVLTVLLRGGDLSSSYSAADGPLVLNVAVLGSGLETKVTAGENRGRTLAQDFVALSHGQFVSPDGHWHVPLPVPQVTVAKPQRYALAAWVTTLQDNVPLQATGGYLTLP